MAHYAFLDKNNIVTEVITGIDETETIEGIDPETWYGNFRNQICKRTSYNNNYRYNFASVGYYFDESFGKDGAFIPPQPYNSWTLNEETCLWEPPIPYPSDGKIYTWNEENGAWEEIS